MQIDFHLNGLNLIAERVKFSLTVNDIETHKTIQDGKQNYKFNLFAGGV